MKWQTRSGDAMSSYLLPGDHLEHVEIENRYGGGHAAPLVEVFSTESRSEYVMCCVSLVVVEIDDSQWIEATTLDGWGTGIELFPLRIAVKIIPKQESTNHE